MFGPDWSSKLDPGDVYGVMITQTTPTRVPNHSTSDSGVVAVGGLVEDDPRPMSEPTFADPSTNRRDAAASSPNLRLAGTLAAPITDSERDLLELRSNLVHAIASEEAEARVVRDRLARTGRRDAMATVTGSDVFERSSRVYRDLLAVIDERLVATERSNDGRSRS